MKKNQKNEHENFIKYKNFIFNHKKYRGLFSNESEKRWVAPGKSELGKKRRLWWLDLKKKYESSGVRFSNHALLSPVCLYHHPTKIKNCHVCGEEWNLEYVYPTKGTLNKINLIFKKKYLTKNDVTIFKIVNDLFLLKNFYDFDKIFPGIKKFKLIEEVNEFIQNKYVNKFSSKLSPGAMSNCPDRFDGFHSYCLGCRSREDKGRSKDNLQRYGEDRRAYEFWSDGDWKAASWLMKIFNKHGKSPDHIGPISLGFCHRPKFWPLSSKSQNSSKGNRLTMEDFNELIKDEKNGVQIISWHSKHVWDFQKKKIKSLKDLYKLNKILRQNIHNVMYFLYELNNLGYKNVLKKMLNPEYAYYEKIQFHNFDPSTGQYEKISKTLGSKTQYQRNADRYIRKSFKALTKYKNKENRNISNITKDKINEYINFFTKDPSKNNLIKTVNEIGRDLLKEFN